MSEASARLPEPSFTSCLRAFEGELDYVFRTLRRHGISVADAEDLAQEVFLVVWRRWASFDRSRALRPWLAGIAFRLAYNHRERRGRERPGGVLEVMADAPTPDDQLVATRDRSLVMTALARLPEKHRAPVVLCDLDELPMLEIASILGVPVATAYTRVRRGRQAFAAEVTRLQRDGEQGRPVGFGAVAALLQSERALVPAPRLARRRVQARLRALASDPPPAAKGPRRPSPPGPGVAGAVAAEIAVLAVVAALAVAPWSTPAPTAPTSAAGAAAAGTATFGPGRRASRRLIGRATPPSFEPAAAGLARGLAGYWRFDDGPGATVARDLSGRGNDCRLLRLDARRAWIEGARGGAIDLRGRGWLECPQAQLPRTSPPEITVALWVNRARAAGRGGHRALVTREQTASDRDDYFFGFHADALKVSGTRWESSTRARFTVPAGRWSHLAFTHASDGATLLYVDGREAARETNGALPLGRGDRRLTIGAGRGSNEVTPGQDFDGALDELAIYDRVLGPAEVAALAAGAQPPLAR